MAMTEAMRLGVAGSPAGKPWLERNFYFVLSLIVGVVVVWAFSYTIGPRLLHPDVSPPLIVWVHGAVFFGWAGLYILQSALVRSGNVALHRRLGWWFAAVGAAVPIAGLAATWVMFRWEVLVLHRDLAGRIYFLPAPILDMLSFSIPFALAVQWRKRPEYHRRLMLVAAAALTAAAWGRFPWFSVPGIDFYAGVDGLILLGVLRDAYYTRRLHPVYGWSLALLVPPQLAAVYMDVHHAPAWWETFGSMVLGF